MKRLLMLAAAAALLLPTISQAQPQGNRPDQRPGGNGGHNGSGSPGRPGGNGGPGTKPVPLPGPDRPGPDRPGNGMRPPPPTTKPSPPIMRPPPRPPGPGMRPPPRPPQFSWRGRWYGQVHGPVFRYPPGYAYRRWTVGAFLPALFFSATYFYDDWRRLGIEPPPPGRRWVRYGSDLVLVNTRTRRIEDVIYNVFY
jgi:Ni/Co efflux regulator RcnB